jgi:hypothetical protein
MLLCLVALGALVFALVGVKGGGGKTAPRKEVTA